MEEEVVRVAVPEGVPVGVPVAVVLVAVVLVAVAPVEVEGPQEEVLVEPV